jgi:hypothetical protein
MSIAFVTDAAVSLSPDTPFEGLKGWRNTLQERYQQPQRKI